MTDLQANTIEHIRQTILYHNLKSGEIIFEFGEIGCPDAEPNEIVLSFFKNYDIKFEGKNLFLISSDKETSLDSIKFGLGSKPNYSLFDAEFNESKKSKLAFTFFGLFDWPKFFQIENRIYQKEIPLDDFWLSGGALLIDKNYIGILWVNDLYDYFG